MRIILALLLVLCASGCAAREQVICAGDAKLKGYEGYWADARLMAALPKLGSWVEALAAANAPEPSIAIRDSNIFVSQGWHELDDVNRCVRVDGQRLWLQPRKNDAGPERELIAIGATTREEATLYLDKLFRGCYRSEAGEAWCLASDAVTIDGKRTPVILQLDLSEGPTYGTPLRVENQPLPFWIFVPRGTGWAVFRDDWASSETRVPVDPAVSTPWRTLTRQP